MKWNRKYLYPAFVFVLFMLFSNSLFLNIFSAANETRVEWFSDKLLECGEDFTSLRGFRFEIEEQNLDVRRPIMLEGRILTRGGVKTKDLLLVSENKAYIIRDLSRLFDMLVSTYNIIDGEYRLAIRLRFDDSEEEIIRTKYGFILRNSRLFDFYIGLKKELKFIPDYSKEIRYSLDEFSFADGRIKAAGWAYIRGRETRNQEVYLSVIDEHGKEHTYISSKGFRPDVGQAFDNSHYNYSGFRIDVPAEGLRGEVRLDRIIIEDEGLFQVSVPIPGKGMSEEQSPRVELDDVPLHSEDVVHHIDVFEKGGDGASIRGWGYLKGRETAGQRVYLLLVDKKERGCTYLSRSVSRPDVAEAFGDPRYKESGFSFYIKDSCLNVDFHKARLIIENEGLYKTGEFQLKR